MKATDPYRHILNGHGHENLSSKPISLPMGYKIPETLAEQVARLVRKENFHTAMGGPEAETFEEADDFDVGDDFDPTSPFEQVFDPILQRDITAAEYMTNQAEYKKLYEAALPPPEEETTEETTTTEKTVEC